MATGHFEKKLDCFNCKCSFSIDKEKFSEELYDAMKKYNEDQLIWLCKNCKGKAGYAFQFLIFVEQQKRLEDQLSELKQIVENVYSTEQRKHKFFEKEISQIKNVVESSSAVEQQKYKCFENKLSQLQNTVETSSDSISELKDKVRRLSLASVNNNHAETLNGIKGDHTLTFKNTKDEGCATLQTLKSDNNYPVVQHLEITTRFETRVNCCDSGHQRNGDFSPNCQEKCFNPLSPKLETVKCSLSSTNKPETIAQKKPVAAVTSNSAIKAEATIITKESKAAVTKLKSVMKEKIKIDKDEMTQSKSVVIPFLNKLIDALKENDDFNCLYENCYPTGSSYEGLRITHATEYDFDIILKIPYRKAEFFNSTKAYAKCQLKLPPQDQDIKDKVILKFLRDNSQGNYLVPEKVQAWMQSVLSKTLLKNIEFHLITDVKMHKSGPAQTIDILPKGETAYISLDLVPVVRFGYPDRREISEINFLAASRVIENHKFWFLVPKSYESIGLNDRKMTDSECKISWRVHFPELEKSMLHDMACVKPIIKLLKLIRDQEKWDPLASYYLKTVVMLEVKNNPRLEYWKEDLMFDRFLQALENLSFYLQKQKLPYIFDPDYNLIHKINSATCSNYHCRLQKLISKFKKSHLYIDEYFSLSTIT